MKTNDDDDAPRLKTVIQDPLDGCFELVELIVDGDPQGLKDACGGVPASRAVCAPLMRLARRALADNRVGQIATRANRAPRTPGHNVAGDSAAVWFFAIEFKNLTKRVFVKPGHQPGGRFSLTGIEPQIERSV